MIVYSDKFMLLSVLPHVSISTYQRPSCYGVCVTSVQSQRQPTNATRDPHIWLAIVKTDLCEVHHDEVRWGVKLFTTTSSPSLGQRWRWSPQHISTIDSSPVHRTRLPGSCMSACLWVMNRLEAIKIFTHNPWLVGWWWRICFRLQAPAGALAECVWRDLYFI